MPPPPLVPPEPKRFVVDVDAPAGEPFSEPRAAKPPTPPNEPKRGAPAPGEVDPKPVAGRTVPNAGTAPAPGEVAPKPVPNVVACPKPDVVEGDVVACPNPVPNVVAGDVGACLKPVPNPVAGDALPGSVGVAVPNPGDPDAAPAKPEKPARLARWPKLFVSGVKPVWEK